MSNQEIFSQRGVYLAPHPTQAFGRNFAPTAFAIQERAAHPNLNAGPGEKGFQEGVAYTLEARHHVQAVAATGDVFHTLRGEGFDASEDGKGRGAGAVAISFQPGNLSRGAGASPSTQTFPTLKADHGRGLSDQQPHVAVAFSSKDYGADAGEIAPTMRSMGHNESHANGGWQLAVAFEPGVMSRCGGHYYDNVNGCLRKEPGDNQMSVVNGMQVRRLTPTECERLQGFPDGHTLIPWRGKPASECPDGPRYTALGNSMAVPVMRWIGARLDAALRERQP